VRVYYCSTYYKAFRGGESAPCVKEGGGHNFRNLRRVCEPMLHLASSLMPFFACERLSLYSCSRTFAREKCSQFVEMGSRISGTNSFVRAVQKVCTGHFPVFDSFFLTDAEEEIIIGANKTIPFCFFCPFFYFLLRTQV
jgi:hypothetical protein